MARTGRAELDDSLAGRLVLYLASIALGVAQGGSIFDGIVLKGILLMLFINGIGSARQYEEAKRRVAQQGGKG